MIFIAILLSFVSLVGDLDPVIAIQRKDMPRLFDASTKYGDLVVDVKSSVVYLAKGKPTKIADFVGTALLRDGKPVREVDQFFDWNPKPVELKLVDTETVSYETREKYTATLFASVGPAVVAMTLGEQRVEVPLKVVSIDYEIGQNSGDLIKDLGLADSVEELFVKWPTNERVEGVFYTVSVQERIRAIEQWRFNAFPHCVFSIEDRKIVAIDSVCINPFDKANFPIAHARRRVEEAKRRYEVEDKVNSGIRSQPSEEFTMKDGTKFLAAWIEFKNGKHQLEDADGKTVEYGNSELSTKTLNRFKEIRKAKLDLEKPKSKK